MTNGEKIILIIGNVLAIFPLMLISYEYYKMNPLFIGDSSVNQWEYTTNAFLFWLPLLGFASVVKLSGIMFGGRYFFLKIDGFVICMFIVLNEIILMRNGMYYNLQTFFPIVACVYLIICAIRVRYIPRHSH